MSGQMVIDGRFELLERLGSGGMGTVWRALDLALQREVALKEVRLADPASAGEDPSTARMQRERVMREARTLARLDHPNVVTIHHIVDGPETAHPWIVMELVRGRSLEDRLEDGPLTPAEAAVIGRGVLAALHCAHEAGICHRDVKPGNVLLRNDGRPVLTDFGIAALSEWSRVTATGGLVGSPAYIAPERLHGQEGNPASDLWSLGMLLYIAVEGHNPMRRATAAATLAAVLKGEVPPPRQAGPLTPVLQALLVLNPAGRPAAAQLDQMLAEAAGGTPAPVTNPMIGSPAPAKRRFRAGPVVAVVLAVVTAGAMFSTAVLVLPKVLNDAVGRVTTGATPGRSGPPGVPASGGGAGGLGPGTGSGPGPGATGAERDLLTPDRIRSVITALERVSGGTEFTKFTAFEEYAFAEAPVRGQNRLYDTFTYRNGRATREGAGGTLAPDDAKVKLRSLNWAALPTLLNRAQRTLGVTKPTNRYVIVDPGWAFANEQPVMLIYLMDDYGGAYLAADRQGKVLRSFPRGS